VVEGTDVTSAHSHHSTTKAEKELIVVNVSGKIVFALKNPAEWQTVDVSILPKGIYVIRMMTENHAVATGRFVKM
jgi:hypothetical protein